MDVSLLNAYSEFLLRNQGVSALLLILFGFVGGLLSSLSPCVLSLLPINLAYIGTLKISNRQEALVKAGSFVLGVVVILTLLGALSNLAFAVFTQYKSLIYILVGFFVIVMSLALIEVIKLPLPQFVSKIPDSSPFVVGLVFALVSSPCSSPILFGVLSVAGSLGSTFKSVIIMFAYSLGYTAIIFFASLFTGLMKQLNWFKEHNQTVTRASAVVLALVGAVYLYWGLIDLL
jgi:cytochrome c-type biogenesis protein